MDTEEQFKPLIKALVATVRKLTTSIKGKNPTNVIYYLQFDN